MIVSFSPLLAVLGTLMIVIVGLVACAWLGLLSSGFEIVKGLLHNHPLLVMLSLTVVLLSAVIYNTRPLTPILVDFAKGQFLLPGVGPSLPLLFKLATSSRGLFYRAGFLRFALVAGYLVSAWRTDSMVNTAEEIYFRGLAESRRVDKGMEMMRLFGMYPLVVVAILGVITRVVTALMTEEVVFRLSGNSEVERRNGKLRPPSWLKGFIRYYSVLAEVVGWGLPLAIVSYIREKYALMLNQKIYEEIRITNASNLKSKVRDLNSILLAIVGSVERVQMGLRSSPFEGGFSLATCRKAAEEIISMLDRPFLVKQRDLKLMQGYSQVLLTSGEKALYSSAVDTARDVITKTHESFEGLRTAINSPGWIEPVPISSTSDLLGEMEKWAGPAKIEEYAKTLLIEVPLVAQKMTSAYADHNLAVFYHDLFASPRKTLYDYRPGSLMRNCWYYPLFFGFAGILVFLQDPFFSVLLRGQSTYLPVGACLVGAGLGLAWIISRITPSTETTLMMESIESRVMIGAGPDALTKPVATNEDLVKAHQRLNEATTFHGWLPRNVQALLVTPVHHQPYYLTLPDALITYEYLAIVAMAPITGRGFDMSMAIGSLYKGSWYDAFPVTSLDPVTVGGILRILSQTDLTKVLEALARLSILANPCPLIPVLSLIFLMRTFSF